jgi:outer membrane protein TolC
MPIDQGLPKMAKLRHIALASASTNGETEAERGVRPKWLQTVMAVSLALAVPTLALEALASGQVVAQVEATPQAASEGAQPSSQANTGAPVTITLQDAIARARKYYSVYRSAETNAALAQENSKQARASLLPSISYTQQFLGTQGNGTTPNGRFVTQDGVHVYRAWGVFHQDVPAGFFALAPYRRAVAGAALAQAQAEIARRGLTVTVTNSYYGLIVAQRKYASAQQLLEQIGRFLQTTKDRERVREVAHADVVKAQLQFDQQQIAFQEAQLAMDNARLALAVLLSPNLDQNFTTVDDVDNPPVLPSLDEVKAMAARENPTVRSAMEALKQANQDVTVARAGFFPTFSVDGVYGIEANAFALHSTSAAFPERGKLPNLGYFVTATMNVPIWNWGSTESKLRQAKYSQRQAKVELSQVQRETLSNLCQSYNEANLARSEIATLREAAGLAAETLRLATLRYQAGEAIELEVVDAQNALGTARNALDSGEARYRVALATLQTVTGDF